MVLPVQNSESVAPKTEGIPYIPDIANETSPITPEGIPAPSSSTPQTTDSKEIVDDNDKNAKEAPQPGKIVDKAKDHKERISTLVTSDPITIEADEEENKFIPLVEEAHDNPTL